MSLDDVYNCSINLTSPQDINCLAACPADLNLDGLVGTDDLLIMLANFGSYCE